MNRKEQNIAIFEDSMDWIEREPALSGARRGCGQKVGLQKEGVHKGCTQKSRKRMLWQSMKGQAR